MEGDRPWPAMFCMKACKERAASFCAQENVMFKTILVPTDGSALSDKAVATAIEFAQKSGKKIVGLSVAEPYPFAVLAEATASPEPGRGGGGGRGRAGRRARGGGGAAR